MNFRSLCCFGRAGVDVSLEVFNQLCFLPKTKWGIKLSNSGSSVAASTLNTEETTAFTSNFAATVFGIMHEVLRDVTAAHPKKETMLKFVPPAHGVPVSCFKAIIGPDYKDTPISIPPLSTLCDCMAHCIDHALQVKLTSPTSWFFCAQSGAYWQEANKLFDAKQLYLQCCSKFPAYLEEFLAERNTTLDKLAGLKAPSIHQYGVEAMVEEAYTCSTQTGMDYQDLQLSDAAYSIFQSVDSWLCAEKETQVSHSARSLGDKTYPRSLYFQRPSRQQQASTPSESRQAPNPEQNQVCAFFRGCLKRGRHAKFVLGKSFFLGSLDRSRPKV